MCLQRTILLMAMQTACTDRHDLAALGACVGAVTGSMFGTMSWILYTHIVIGTITAANLSANYALLTGAVVSLGWSILMCVTFSFIWPDKEPFQWERLTKVSRHTYAAQD